MSQSVLQDGKIFVGKSVKPEYLDLTLANRHGLITGATGTGKTVTLQVLAEGFSRAGVPVFAADIKGDLSGIAEVGEPKDFLLKRAAEVGLENYKNSASPVVLWDVFGAGGHPIRATVEDMGPLLLSRMLELNDVQEGVLNIAFRWAEDERTAGDAKMAILDLQDLRSIIDEMGKRATELRSRYGNIAPGGGGHHFRQLDHALVFPLEGSIVELILLKVANFRAAVAIGVNVEINLQRRKTALQDVIDHGFDLIEIHAGFDLAIGIDADFVAELAAQ